MSSDTLWLALGLVLVFEGLFPFAAPAAWRRMFQQVLQLGDGQIRFFGLCALLTGFGLVLWLG
jgi:uncharacterized protein YjeT (DUF2065 family)